MNFEPQKLFIGLVDFFSILLPGALLTWALGDRLRPWAPAEPTARWIAFLFVAWLIGHFVFLLGSVLLDDHVYDPIRDATRGAQIRRLAKGQRRSFFVLRGLARLVFKEGVDAPLRQAVALKERHLAPLGAEGSINAFQWCKARLILKHPAAIAEVERLEADSKFFRSLLIVLLILVALGLSQHRKEVAAAAAVLLPFAFWRFCERRAKAVNQAYWYLITLESQSRRREPLRQEPVSHAGGVVLRDGQECLLLQASDDPGAWVLPKGHVEPAEKARETAVREVLEETGVWARITGELSDVSYIVDGANVTVRYFLMEALASTRPADAGRERVWLPVADAIARATHPETQDLLRTVAARLPRTAAAASMNPAA
ncbi:MAG TPA: NUDIX domain-containing protein [Myxococcales bacterium]|nr:NUDIX domain-containing protein [Myxococcales bacterium]